MTQKTYDLLKFTGQIIGYVGIFISALSEIWGFGYGTEIAASIAAAAVLLNSIVRASSDAYFQDHDIVAKEDDSEDYEDGDADA